MSRRLLVRVRSRQSATDTRMRPATRGHLLRPLSRTDGFRRNTAPYDMECGPLMVCTVKQPPRAADPKHMDEHSTKQQTQITRVHTRTQRSRVFDRNRDHYRSLFQQNFTEEQQCFQQLCRLLGVS